MLLAAKHSAMLTIQFEGPGTLWLDRVSLIDTNAVLGLWRPDVVKALKSMNAGVVRFGGSTVEEFEGQIPSETGIHVFRSPTIRGAACRRILLESKSLFSWYNTWMQNR